METIMKLFEIADIGVNLFLLLMSPIIVGIAIAIVIAFCDKLEKQKWRTTGNNQDSYHSIVPFLPGLSLWCSHFFSTKEKDP